jgi:hypothetical protein
LNRPVSASDPAHLWISSRKLLKILEFSKKVTIVVALLPLLGYHFFTKFCSTEQHTYDFHNEESKFRNLGRCSRGRSNQRCSLAPDAAAHDSAATAAAPVGGRLAADATADDSPATAAAPAGGCLAVDTAAHNSTATAATSGCRLIPRRVRDSLSNQIQAEGKTLALRLIVSA